MTSTPTDIREKLANLFREAGSAHHKAFIATDGEDPEWPLWYAGFLQPTLNALISAEWTESEVEHLLVEAEHARSMISPRPDWPFFYANVFLQEYRHAASSRIDRISRKAEGTIRIVERSAAPLYRLTNVACQKRFKKSEGCSSA